LESYCFQSPVPEVIQVQFLGDNIVHSLDSCSALVNALQKCCFEVVEPLYTYIFFPFLGLYGTTEMILYSSFNVS